MHCCNRFQAEYDHEAVYGTMGLNSENTFQRKASSIHGSKSPIYSVLDSGAPDAPDAKDEPPSIPDCEACRNTSVPSTSTSAPLSKTRELSVRPDCTAQRARLPGRRGKATVNDAPGSCTTPKTTPLTPSVIMTTDQRRIANSIYCQLPVPLAASAVCKPM